MRVASAAAMALLALPAASASVGPVYESFEQGWGAWSVDHDVFCYHQADPCPWEWSAERLPGPAIEGAWGIAMAQDGLNDSGAVWVERKIAVPPGDRVEVAFWVLSPYLGPPTAWEVRAYVGLADPELEWDLASVGTLDDLPGWHRFCLAAPTPEAASVWVAAGVRAAWESGTRVHGLDYISVRGATGGEPCGLLEDPCHIAGTPCSIVRAACEASACPEDSTPVP